jgi:hypothetical protein
LGGQKKLLKFVLDMLSLLLLLLLPLAYLSIAFVSKNLPTAAAAATGRREVACWRLNQSADKKGKLLTSLSRVALSQKTVSLAVAVV